MVSTVRTMLQAFPTQVSKLMMAEIHIILKLPPALQKFEKSNQNFLLPLFIMSQLVFAHLLGYQPLQGVSYSTGICINVRN